MKHRKLQIVIDGCHNRSGTCTCTCTCICHCTPSKTIEDSETVKEDLQSQEKSVKYNHDHGRPRSPISVGAHLLQPSSMEESHGAAELEDSQKNALQELKLRLKEAIDNHELNDKVCLWGIPLLHTMRDERTDVLLLKFLRPRDFKVSEAFTMLKNTILWRKSFGTDNILKEDLGSQWDGVIYMHGHDKEGHPVCYNNYGAFQDENLYNITFGDDDKSDRLLRWRIQFIEKGIQKLSFKPGGINSMVQITDLENSSGLSKTRGLQQYIKKTLPILEDNYPEFVSKKIFVNAPRWYITFFTLIYPFLTQEAKSKFVVTRPARVTETLFKYISPEYVPVEYGGLRRKNDTVFSTADGAVSDIFIKAGLKQIIDIPATEVGSTIVWDITVLGWEVTYGEEFVPNTEGRYTIMISKMNTMASDEKPLRNSFKIHELGKVILTIENTSSKKKRVVYRAKVKSD